MAFGLTDSGYRAPRLADFLQIIRERLNVLWIAAGAQEVPDYERDTVLANLTVVMAERLDALGDANQAVYDAWSVANATELQLGNLCLIVGVRRLEATNSLITLRCTGTDGTPILQGKLAEGGGTDDRARWEAIEDGTIGQDVAGYVDVQFRAVETGSITATVGQVDTIVTTVTGWDTVTNQAGTNDDPNRVGREREKDARLRNRRQRALAVAGSTSTNAILSALLQLDFIASAVVTDNTDPTMSVVKDGITIEAASVACVVSPDVLTVDEQQQVVDAIFDRLGGGTRTSGDQSGSATKIDGRSHEIKYYLATDSPVDVAWVLVLAPGYEVADVEDTLLELVEDYFLTLTTGATVYPLALCTLAGSVEGIDDVTSILLNGTPAAVEHNANELPVLGTHSVS